MVPREAHNLQTSVRIRPPQQAENRASMREFSFEEDGFEEGGRGNICFPVKEGRAEGSSENRGFPKKTFEIKSIFDTIHTSSRRSSVG